MTLYSGIFLRNALGDTNTLPRKQAGDTTSPDIINSGTTPAQDPQTEFGSNYDQSLGADPVYGSPNNIYIRGKNYASNEVVGNASLYWSYARQLDNPSTWLPLKTGSGSNSSALTADSQGVAVTATPFVWTPQTPSPGSPYVLIASVSDPDNPDPVPAYMKSLRPLPYAQWQANLGGVAALQLQAPTPPPAVATYSLGGILVLGNAAQEQLTFNLLVENGVVGDSMSASFDATDAGGNSMGLASTQITLPNNMTAGFQATVAPAFESNFRFEYAAQNAASPPNPTLTLQISRIVSSGGGGGNPFGPSGGNSKAVLVAQFVMTTSLPS